MSLLKMSGYGVIMIIAVTILRSLLIHRLPKKTFYILWIAVLIRLLIPFHITSPFSVYSMLGNKNYTAEQQAVTEEIVVSKASGTSDTIKPINQGMSPVAFASSANLSKRPMIPVQNVIWIIGMILFIGYFLFLYIKYYKNFQMSLPIKVEEIDIWLKEHQIGREIQVRTSSYITSPLTYGILHPTILFPKNMDWTEDKQLRYVLEHEFVHIRRFDLITKLCMTAALCIHWFNPMVWVMYILLNRDIELSCDEEVVRHFGICEKSSYAYVLIDMESKKVGLSPFYSGFSKNAIEERILAIMKIKKISVAAVMIAVFLIIGVTAVFATSATKSKKTADNSENTEFTGEEYQLLEELQYEDYEAMSIADYRQKPDAIEVYAVYENSKLVGLRKASEEEQKEWTDERKDNSAKIIMYDMTDDDRVYGYGTQEDYDSLLVYNTDQYHKMSVADFNAYILDWANEDEERNNRINEDNSFGDRQVPLSAEEESFVALTEKLSMAENTEYVKSLQTGEIERNPVYNVDYIPYRTVSDNQHDKRYGLWYQFSYYISNKDAITVEERDNAIGGFMNKIYTFWTESDIDELMDMEQWDIAELISNTAKQFSTDKITINIKTTEKTILFEKTQ